MKAKDLHIPCTFQNRRPCLLDGMFYIPDYFFEHEKYPFSLKDIFRNNFPIQIEYCSGNGQWICEKAKTHPSINFLAVEKRFDRARKIWVKAKNQNLTNLFVILGEAKTFTDHYLADDGVQKIFVNFPDPWPKKRHAKHRLIQKEFSESLSRILQKNGELILVTDHEDYKKQMIEVLFSIKHFEPKFEKPYYVTDWPHFGGSYFENLWRDKGKTIYFLSFIKKELL